MAKVGWINFPDFSLSWNYVIISSGLEEGVGGGGLQIHVYSVCMRTYVHVCLFVHGTRSQRIPCPLPIKALSFCCIRS